MRRNTRNTGQRWTVCTRTGFEFPMAECSPLGSAPLNFSGPVAVDPGSAGTEDVGTLVADRFADEPGFQESPDPRFEITEPEFPDDALWFRDA